METIRNKVFETNSSSCHSITLTYPTVNFIYKCTHSYTHPNLGRMLTKGNLYTCKSVDKDKDLIQMVGKSNGAACDIDFFDKHFEEVYTADSPKARKMYVKNVLDELLKTVEPVFNRTKFNCMNEIITQFNEELVKKYGM